MSPPRDERGWAVPVVVALTGVLLTIAVAISMLGGLLVQSRHTAVAADLAALAGAVALQYGQDACAAASASAADNGTDVTDCAVAGDRVRVTVATAPREILGRTFRVRADAHAGPR